MKCVILSSGSGERLWPLARALSPKSLLKLYNDKSLLQNTFELACSIVEAKNIVTVTNIAQYTDIKLRLEKLTNKPVIISEPAARDSAASIMAALTFIKRKKDDIAVILPSDLVISNKKSFNKTIESAVLSAKEGNIVLVGTKTLNSEDGYGYIKLGKKTGNVYKVAEYTEEMSSEQCSQDIKYYRSTGIIVSKISVLLNAIETFSPSLYDKYSSEMFDENKKIKYEYYESILPESIDSAVLKRAENLTLVELKAKWSDMGSWKSLYDNTDKDSDGNVISGNVICDGVKNSLIYTSKELVAASKINNKIVVETEDAVLVCDKDKSNEIGKIVNTLKNIKSKTVESHKTVFRPWGFYTCLNSGKGWLTKIITVAAGHKLSLQSHNYRSEHWVVLEGTATVILDNEKHILNKAQSIDIPIKSKHSLQNHTKDVLKILEVQKGDYISEDDIIRYEDMYGRVN